MSHGWQPPASPDPVGYGTSCCCRYLHAHSHGHTCTHTHTLKSNKKKSFLKNPFSNTDQPLWRWSTAERKKKAALFGKVDSMSVINVLIPLFQSSGTHCPYPHCSWQQLCDLIIKLPTRAFGTVSARHWFALVLNRPLQNIYCSSWDGRHLISLWGQ